MLRIFSLLLLASVSFSCGGDGGTSLVGQNNGENNGANNGGPNNGANNGKNNDVGPNNVLRTNNSTGEVPTLTSNEPVVQFGYDFFLEVCERFIECKDTVSIAQIAEGGRIATTASCLESLVNRDHPLIWKDSLDAGRLTYDESKKGQCISAIGAISCDDLGTLIPNPKNISGCEGAISGTGLVDAECRNAIDCSAGMICDDCPGKCRELPLLECSDGELCGSTEFCDTETGLCQTLHVDGGDCANFSQCAVPFACIEGTCVGPKIGAPGDACLEDTVCSLGYYCDSVCRAYKTLGQDCSNNFCEAPLFCGSAKKCEKAVETGSCGNSDECISADCVNGSCQAPVDACIIK